MTLLIEEMKVEDGSTIVPNEAQLCIALNPYLKKSVLL